MSENCDGFIGPCIHGRDPYTRCDICGELTESEAEALAKGELALCDGCSVAVTRPGSLCLPCAEDEAWREHDRREIAELRAEVKRARAEGLREGAEIADKGVRACPGYLTHKPCDHQSATACVAAALRARAEEVER